MRNKMIPVEILLRLKNWGPISYGEIYVKPLTILIGPNNTGKSYTTMTYYALVRSLRSLFIRYRLFFPRLFEKKIENILKDENSIKAIISSEKFSDFIEKLVDFSFEKFSNILCEEINERKSNIVKEIERTFSSDINQLITHGESESEIDFRIRTEHYIISCNVNVFREESPKVNILFKFSEMFKQEMKNTIKQRIVRYISTRYFNIIRRKIFPFQEISSIEDGWEKITINIKKKIINYISPIIFSSIEENYRKLITNMALHAIGDIHYLPASRSGIMQSYRSIASAILSMAPFAPIRGIEIPRISGPVADFLGELIEITSERMPILTKNRKNIKELISKLETKILSGNVKLRKEVPDGIPEIVYVFDNKESIPLARSSSMVSELAPLDLFIKYLLEEGDNLIIEEPEAHLHPNAQAEIALILAELINILKLRLLITTHSDYLIYKLNILISLSELSSTERKKYSYTNLDIVNYKNVSAYLYRRNTDGKVIIEPLNVSKKGIPDDEFRKINEEIYDETMKIYYKVQKE